MKQILGINLPLPHLKESLSGCNNSETLAEDSHIPVGIDLQESMVSAITDRLSEDRPPQPAILDIDRSDEEALLAIGQEADHSSEIDRFITDLLPEVDQPDGDLTATVFTL